MENRIMSDKQTEMEKVADELFSIIPGIAGAAAVPVLQAEDLSEKEFKRSWVARNRPCLIKGAVKGWPALQKWTDKDYWIATCDNDKKEVITHMNYYGWKRRKEGSESMQFHDAIARLFQGGDHIFSMPAQEVNKKNLFARVLQDAPGFSFLPEGYSMPIWDSPAGLYIYRRAATAWHVHHCDETLMCQVNGAKIVALLPPDIPDTKAVTGFLENELYLEGQRLSETLDLKPVIAVVEKGDALYIPPHWFHCVVPLDAEVGFTFLTGFRSPWHIYGDFSNYFVRRLYGTAFRNASLRFKLVIPIWGSYAVLSHLMRKIKRNTPFFHDQYLRNAKQ